MPESVYGLKRTRQDAVADANNAFDIEQNGFNGRAIVRALHRPRRKLLCQSAVTLWGLRAGVADAARAKSGGTASAASIVRASSSSM